MQGRARLLCFIVGTAVFAATESAGQTRTAARPAVLVPGKPVRVEAGAGAYRLFHVNVSGGRASIELRIREFGVDVRTSIRDAAQTEVCASDSWPGGWNTDVIACRLPRGGTYTVRVDGQAVSATKPAVAVEWAITPAEEAIDIDIQNALASAHAPLKRDPPNLEAGLAALSKAQVLAESRGDRLRAAEAMVLRGMVEAQRHKLEESARLLEEAARIYRENGDKAGEARALNEAGWAYHLLGQSEKDEQHQRRALDLWREAGDERGKAATVTHLGRQELRRDRGQALVLFQEAVAYYRRIGDTAGESNALDYIAQLQQSAGDLQAALETFQRSLRLVAGRGDLSEAYSRNNLGEIYHRLGEYSLARTELAKAANMGARLRDSTLESHARMSLGAVLSDFGRPEEALGELRRAIPIMDAARDSAGLAGAWNNSARALSDLGRYAEARDALAKALGIFRALNHVRGVNLALSSLGRLSLKLDDYDSARKYLDEALAGSRGAGDLNQTAIVLGHIAHLEAEGKKYSEARRKIDEAIALVESERARIGREDLRASYFSIVRVLYERKVDILMRLHVLEPEHGWHTMAFEVSEAARAREAVDAIASSRQRFAGVPPDLIEREAKLRAQIRAALRTGNKGADDLLADLHAVQSEIRARSPRWAESSQPAVFQHAETRHLLDSETAALEFLLGDERSYLWVVKREGTNVFILPPAKQIAAAAAKVRKAATVSRAAWEAAFWPAAAELSEMLLGPAKALLTERRLAIVADGPLHTVPFAALPLPEAGTTSLRPLIADREIIMLPSLALLSRVRASERPRESTGARIAVIGDPVYTADDDRLLSSVPGRRVPGGVGNRGGQSTRFRRLDYSGDEVNAIAETAGKQALRLTGFEATVAKISGSALAEFDILHFATHAVVNEDRPEMSGLALSMIDRDGRPVDGFLRLMDIYALEVSPRLVVLSACETAMGRTLVGEGVMGLTRGFLSVGADGVVSSLWQVRDNATAELMRSFYRAMFAKKLPPVAALREAQLALWNSRRWRAPYFWAGFVSHGEWK